MQLDHFRREHRGNVQSMEDVEALMRPSDMWGALQKALADDKVQKANDILVLCFAYYSAIQNKENYVDGVSLAYLWLDRMSDYEFGRMIERDDKVAALFARAATTGNNFGAMSAGGEFIRAYVDPENAPSLVCA